MRKRLHLAQTAPGSFFPLHQRHIRFYRSELRRIVTNHWDEYGAVGFCTVLYGTVAILAQAISILKCLAMSGPSVSTTDESHGRVADPEQAIYLLRRLATIGKRTNRDREVFDNTFSKVVNLLPAKREQVEEAATKLAKRNKRETAVLALIAELHVEAVKGIGSPSQSHVARGVKDRFQCGIVSLLDSAGFAFLGLTHIAKQEPMISELAISYDISSSVQDRREA